MNRPFGTMQDFKQHDVAVETTPKQLLAIGWLTLAAFALLAMPTIGAAASGTGTTSAAASIDFRIVIPQIIRVTPVSQPDYIVIADSDIAQGYVDLDAGSSVKLTSNSRDGYLLTARYDAQLLSKVDIRVSGQQLSASTGAGSMRVTPGLVVDKLVPISYRFHLAAGTRAGDYPWPVALAFSLAAA